MDEQRATYLNALIARCVRAKRLKPDEGDDLKQDCLKAVLEYELKYCVCALDPYVRGIVDKQFLRSVDSQQRRTVIGHSDQRDGKLSADLESETVGRPVVESLYREIHEADPDRQGDPAVNRSAIDITRTILHMTHSGTTEASVDAFNAEAADRQQSYLNSLPERQRAIVEMRLSGESVAEIAQARGISESAVYNALRRVKPMVIFLPPE